MGKAKTAEHVTRKSISFLDVSCMVIGYIRIQHDENTNSDISVVFLYAIGHPTDFWGHRFRFLWPKYFVRIKYYMQHMVDFSWGPVNLVTVVALTKLGLNRVTFVYTQPCSYSLFLGKTRNREFFYNNLLKLKGKEF